MKSRGLQQLVDYQVQRWQIEGTRSAQGPKAPCVALSRWPGAGAVEVGTAVANALNFGFFDIEIVDRISRESGIRRELVADLDEHVRTTIERYVVETMRGRAFAESAYLDSLVRTLSTLGERGLAVILGRGSPYVLDPSRTLRVLLVAPRALRAERIAKREDLSEAEASRRLDREDATRREFLTHHFGVDPDDPTHYDVVVNTGTLSLSAAADLIVGLVREHYPRPR